MGREAWARLAHVLLTLALGSFRLVIRMVRASFSHYGEPRDSLIGRTFVETIQTLGPAYVKIGQIMSTRPDLISRPMIKHLEQLRDKLPPLPFHVVPILFRREFGRELRDVFAEFDPHPVASASIACVYRGRLQDGRLVALKVRRPGAAKLIRSDVRLLRRMATLLGSVPQLRIVPLRPLVDEFGACLERQLDFRLEAAANRRLRSALVFEPDVYVPPLVDDFCGDSILMMEFVGGLHGAATRNISSRKALVAALHVLYRMIFVEGFVHCDMHQGNLHFLPDGRAVLVDFGFMAEIERSARLKFAEFFYAMATNNGRRCAEITLEMASSYPSDLPYNAFQSEVVALVDGAAGSRVSEFRVTQFVLRLFDLQRQYRIRGTTAFTMAIVSLLVLEGIARQTYPDLDFQREAQPYIFRASIRPYRPRLRSDPR